MAARVQIYTTSYCGYCFMAKRLLRARGIAFDEVDVTRDHATRDRIVSETHHSTVPVVFIDGRFIGGSDELHALDEAGELEGLKTAATA